MSTAIKVLAKPSGAARQQKITEGDPTGNNDRRQPEPRSLARICTDDVVEKLGLPHLKSGNEAKSFKLIDDRDWNIATAEPTSETNFFVEGHSALSVVSAIGPKGSGKSTILNRLARRIAFKTHTKDQFDLSHTTRGIDVHSTHHRILVDSQPILSSTVLEQFINGQSKSHFTNLADPLTCCQMIDLQLVTFLIATCDYVVIVCDWLIDVHLLKLISSAIMMIGESNIRAKLVMFCEGNCVIKGDRFKKLVEGFLGKNLIDKYFDSFEDLYSHVTPYSYEKLDLYSTDDQKFIGKNWLESCIKLWNVTIKSSSMFTDYAFQLSETGL